MPIIRSPSNCRCNLWFPYECGGGSVLSHLRTLPPPHPYENQRLQRQYDGLLMMGIVMPETCWAVSVRQSNKILRLIVASSWVFYLKDLPLFILCSDNVFFIYKTNICIYVIQNSTLSVCSTYVFRLLHRHRQGKNHTKFFFLKRVKIW
jgi:hypothetical protein